ncbi:MAG: hypothetical protein K2H09_04530 [Treponemataceae bacterium]|nr:hypothetical protein [Treponemataceae bacterium]
MKLWKRNAALCAAVLAVVVCAAVAAVRLRKAEGQGIVSVTAVAEVSGDGEHVSAVILEYLELMDASRLSAADFSVEGRSIASVATSGTAEKTAASVLGAYVVLNLLPEAPRNSDEGRRRPDAGAPGAGTGEPDFASQSDVVVDITAVAAQTRKVVSAAGTVYAPSGPIASTASIELVVRDFKKELYTDAETGCSIPYFVYLPEGYTADKTYPLVFFVPDASANNGIDTTTLTQGNGAIVWAAPEEQAKHPAIVAAVQYPRSLVQAIGPLTQDAHEWSVGLTLVHNLLVHLISEYSVDTSRIYGTGQSQGCMANIAISDRYPDLFAAQLLVAGQWDVDEMEAMKDKNLWIVVCTGDTKAYPGMNSATERWESLGAKVARSAPWNLDADAAELARDVAAMRAQDCRINYTVFEGGSHSQTWAVAYGIEGIRDWLFEQTK